MSSFFKNIFLFGIIVFTMDAKGLPVEWASDGVNHCKSKMASQSEQSLMAKSGSGLIVVTDALRHILSSENKNITVQMVDMRGVMDSRFSFVLSRYPLKVENKESVIFGTRWEVFRVSGDSGTLNNFLNNNFAKKRVMWVGTKNYGSFATRAATRFSQSEVLRNES